MKTLSLAYSDTITPSRSRSKEKRWIVLSAFLLAFVFSAWAQAQTQWNTTVGAQSNDKGFQALAFLPYEIWIHAGDSIKWTFEPDEIHTVTFITADQSRPFFAEGVSRLFDRPGRLRWFEQRPPYCGQDSCQRRGH